MHEIKSVSGIVLYRSDGATSLREAVVAAVREGAYLSGANLSGAYLRGANLRDADLSGANLRGANLSGANMSGAYLRGADLRGAYLRGANMSGANLSGAYLSGVKLLGAPVRRALRTDNYEFYLWPTEFGWRVQAGCRFFAFDEAWAHWCGPNAKRLNTPLGDESHDILVMFSLAIDRAEDAVAQKAAA